MPQVIFAAPQQFDRHLEAFGNGGDLAGIILETAAAEGAAHAHLVQGDILFGNGKHAGHGVQGNAGLPSGCPDIQGVGIAMVVGGAVHGFHAGMGQVGKLIGAGDHFGKVIIELVSPHCRIRRSGYPVATGQRLLPARGQRFPGHHLWRLSRYPTQLPTAVSP